MKPQDHVLVSNVLARIEPEDDPVALRAEVITALGDAFARGDSAFDREKFLENCNGDGSAVSEHRAPDDGGFAFPVHEMSHDGTYGMSLRDWFAGMVAQGICAAEGFERGGTPKSIAETAYQVANAMLRERAK